MTDRLSFKNSPKSNYLVGNPIIFELDSTVQELIYYDVQVSGNIIFSGAFLPVGINSSFHARISISDLLKSHIKEPTISDPSIICSPVENAFIRVAVVFSQEDFTLQHSCTVYPGGIGKALYYYLSDTDIFSYKLLNTQFQFFMTSRTLGRHILVRESELLPLFFLAVENKEYTVVTEYGDIFPLGSLKAGQMYALCPSIIRKSSLEREGRLPSFLSVRVDGKFNCDITVVPETRAPHKLSIKFINSWGVYEQIEIAGTSSSIPEFDQVNAFMSYDSIIDDYKEQNNRIPIREVISAQCGYKRLDEFLFMRDMLQSNKRYMIDSYGNNWEVIVTAEDFSHDLYPTTPGSILLKIRMVHNDTNFSPEIDETTPKSYYEESIWETGITNGYGILFANSILKTV